MSVQGVTANSSNGAAAVYSGVTDSYTNPNSTLNQTDFLKLLVAQIQYQDPMNPQSDTQMAAQLAQFTSLQQSVQSSASLAMIQANTLVGSTVSIKVDATNSTSGVVTGVVMNNGVPQITVGGTNYNLGQVTSVKPTTTASTASSTPTTTTASSSSGASSSSSSSSSGSSSGASTSPTQTNS